MLISINACQAYNQERLICTTACVCTHLYVLPFYSSSLTAQLCPLILGINKCYILHVIFKTYTNTQAILRPRLSLLVIRRCDSNVPIESTENAPFLFDISLFKRRSESQLLPAF